VDDELMAAVQKATRRRGVTSLWFYAPGLVGQDISPERMERLTGIRLEIDMRAAALRVAVPMRPRRDRGPRRAGAEPPGRAQAVEYGTDEKFAPVVYAADPQAEVLGKLVGSGRAGLVRKRVGGGTAIFSAAPAMPALLVRKLAADAGVHIFADGGQVVYANRSFLAVAGEPGARPVLRLPQEGALYDLFEERAIRLPGGKGPLPASHDGTWVFFRGSRRAWNALDKG
jgi:hypothetical protein